MTAYKNLTKGNVYTIVYRNKVFRGTYKSRYWNKEIDKWHYLFSSLDGFAQYTFETDKTAIGIISNRTGLKC